ncbi:MAG TPA: MFS transporter [Candidatus Dormibacteraeota bacterium]|jgi:MFS family permease|nr:MFS transporter [Candidatus Dormibacteraeota bacterium]
MDSPVVEEASHHRAAADAPRPVSRRFLATLLVGTSLNPLNSSMIAVALVPIARDFQVSVAVVSLLIAGFFVAAAIGQPLMGRLADAVGPRRTFVFGVALVGVSGAAAALAPTFALLVLARVVMAIGSSATYPAALALIRREVGGRRGGDVAGPLGVLSFAGFTTAAMGPVVGGLLVATFGWRGIFAANVPVIAIGLVLAMTSLSADPPSGHTSPRHLLESLDLPGLGLFAVTAVTLLGFLLSAGDQQPIWPLLPVALVALALFILRERSQPRPFVDVRMLARNRALVGVFVQFAALNIVFYSIFFGLPIWLEQARGFNPGQVGLLILPITGIGIASIPVAAVLLRRVGTRPPLVLGGIGLVAGTASLLLAGNNTGVLGLVAIAAVLGLPNGFNNMGMQAALYEASPPESTGAAAGLFQTFRYVGAILATSLIGLFFGRDVTSDGLHALAAVIAVISGFLLLTSLATRRHVRRLSG